MDRDSSDVHRIAVNESLCVGCMTCVLECSFHAFGVFQPTLASRELGDRRLRIVSSQREHPCEIDGQADFRPSCLDCTSKPCVVVCPTGAITVPILEMKLE